MKKYLMMLATVAIAAVVLTSCSEDEKVVPQLTAPEFVQNEQVDDNPVTLSFSWTAVDGVAEYAYTLYDSKDEKVASGHTTQTSVTFTSTYLVPLDYNADYTLEVMAVTADATIALNSDAVKATAHTAQSPIELSIEDLTYRSATFYAVPGDKNMLYQVAQIPVEKYQQYADDKAFIEEYEFGYYQARAQTPPYIFFGVPWTEVMKDLSQKGDYNWHTVILKPETQYIMYAYGCDFATDPSTCTLTTPLIRVFFTTPKWEATSTTQFAVTLESNEQQDGYGVISVKVVPDSGERYMVFFATQNEVEQYGGVLGMCMSRISDYEIGGMVEDFGTSNSLYRGTQTIFNNATGFMPDDDLPSGTPCVAAVCGVDKNGCITTEPVCVEFTVK